MNSNPPDVIQFTCQSCGMFLTVPIQMAGVTGPCPGCQATITSPQAAPSEPSFYKQPSASIQQNSPAVAPISPSLEAILQGSHAGAGGVSHQSTSPQTAGHGGGYTPPLGLPPTGSTWPPAPQVQAPAMAGPLPGAGAVASILQTNLPVRSTGLPVQSNQGLAGAMGGQQQVPQYTSQEPPRRQRQGSAGPPASKRAGAFMLAMFMVLMALGGTAWFFQDLIKAQWREYTLKHQQEDESGSVPSPEEVRAAMQASGTQKKPNEAPEQVKPPDVSSAPPPVQVKQDPSENSNSVKPPASPLTPAPPAEQSIVIKPAEIASATVDNTMPPSSLVEVPATPPEQPLEETSLPLPANTGAKAPAIYEESTPETKPAVDALKKFFEASNWQERAQFVQWPNQMKELMEAYYRSNPDGPISVTHIQLIPRNKGADDDQHPHCVFQVAGGVFKHPMPVMVEQTADGWKVDWLTFIEFKDELLKKFSDTFVDEPSRFHVLARRTHYFDDDIPHLDKKICYELQPPVPGFVAYVFATKGSPLAQQLDRNLGWDVASAAVVLELQWKKQDAYQWVEITAIPQYNWRTPEPMQSEQQPVVSPPAP